MTKKTDYIQQQISTNEIIYIDTCSLMDPDRLNGFLEHAKPLLLKEGKKITIHNCVMEELFKLQISSNLSKRNQANKALDVIYQNHDIFEIIPNDCDESSEYFADKELLKEIFEKRRNHTILLISNDHYLTSDAYNFNKVESVNGNKIHVCYLNHYGDLNICDCVKENRQDLTKNEEIEKEEKVANPKVIVKKEYIETERSIFQTVGIPLATMLLGTLSGYLGSKLIKNS